MSVLVIQDHKLKDEKPMLDEIDQANYFVKALLHQRNDLEVMGRILYRKWIDRNRNIVFQLVTPDATRDLIVLYLNLAQAPGHFSSIRFSVGITGQPKAKIFAADFKNVALEII